MKTRTAAIALTCLSLATLIISGAAIFSSSRVYRVLSLSENNAIPVPLTSAKVTDTDRPSSETSAQSCAPGTATRSEVPDTSSEASAEEVPSESSVPAETEPALTAAAPVIPVIPPEDEEEKYFLFLIHDGGGESLCIRDGDGNELFRRSVSTGRFSAKDRAALESGMEFSGIASAEEALWELLT